jgi:hypothetical protein
MYATLGISDHRNDERFSLAVSVISASVSRLIAHWPKQIERAKQYSGRQPSDVIMPTDASVAIIKP